MLTRRSFLQLIAGGSALGFAGATGSLAEEGQSKSANRILNEVLRRHQIRTGVTEVERQFIYTPESELALVHADVVNNVKAEQRCYVRYMTAAFYPPTQQDVNFVEFAVDAKGRSKQVLVPDTQNPYVPKQISKSISAAEYINRVAGFGLNSLSSASAIVSPEFVEGTDNRIIRFFLNNYDLCKAWEVLIKNEPYFKHIPDLLLSKETGTTRTLIRTDWFLSRAFTEPLYSDLLYANLTKKPVTDTEFQAVWFIHTEETKKARLNKSATVSRNDTIVALNDRRLNRFNGIAGYFHVSDDFKTNLDYITTRDKKKVYVMKDPLEHLVDPPKGCDIISYEPDAHEGIAQLPNGLQVYYISDSAKKLLDVADNVIVRDTRNLNDPRVFNGKSCIWCHDRGLNIVNNIADKNFHSKSIHFSSRDPDTIEFIRRVFATDYGSRMQRDIDGYVTAVGSANLLDAESNAKGFRTFIQWFDYTQINSVQGARELGLTFEQFKTVARRHESQRVQSMVDDDEPVPFPRDVWERYYPALAAIAKLDK